MLLAVAFSPVLIDLAGHLREQPWAAYCVVFLPLFADELRREPRRRLRPGAGWALVGLALALELLLVRGNWARAARPGIALAAVGLGLALGRPSLRSATLLLAFVPVPHALVSSASPALEASLARAAAWLLQPLGSAVWVEAGRYQATFHAAGGSFSLADSDGGVSLVVLLCGLVWYAGCQREWSLARTLATAPAWALLAWPIQVAALAVAGLAVSRVDPAALRLGLDVGPWLSVAALAMLGPCRPTRARPPAPVEPLSSSPS